MAITWRDTYKQPQADVSGLIQSGTLAAKGLTGFGTAIQGFDDTNRLAELTQFTDANALNEAIRRGQFNGASPEVLKQAMNRSSDLLANATNQQTFDYKDQTNPLALNALRRADELGVAGQPEKLVELGQAARLGTLNRPVEYATAQQRALAAGITNQDIVPATQFGQDAIIRGRIEQEAIRVAQNDFTNRHAAGEFSTPPQANAFLNSLPSDTLPTTRAAYQKMLQGIHGASVGPAVLPGSGSTASPNLASAAISGAAGSVTNAAGSPIDATAIGNAIYGQESNSGKADTTKVNSQNVTGPMQVQKATFDGLKKNGVIPANYDWQNPEHNKAAGFAHIADLAKTYKTPEQVAAVYYSGPDAVNADGSINRNRKNPLRPKDPTVGEYVDQVMARAGKPQGTPNQLSPANVAARTAGTNAAAAITTAGTTSNFTSRVQKHIDNPDTDVSEATMVAALKTEFPSMNKAELQEAVDSVKANTATEDPTTKTKVGGLKNNNAIAEIVRESLKTKKSIFSFFGKDDYEAVDSTALKSNIKLYNESKANALTNVVNKEQAAAEKTQRTEANSKVTSLLAEYNQAQEAQQRGQAMPADYMDKISQRLQQAINAADALNVSGIAKATLPISDTDKTTSKKNQEALDTEAAQRATEDAAKTAEAARLANQPVPLVPFNEAAFRASPTNFAYQKNRGITEEQVVQEAREKHNADAIKLAKANALREAYANIISSGEIDITAINNMPIADAKALKQNKFNYYSLDSKVRRALDAKLRKTS